jgi:hypothetical protein
MKHRLLGGALQLLAALLLVLLGAVGPSARAQVPAPAPVPTPVPVDPEPFDFGFEPQAPAPQPVAPVAPAAPAFSYDTVFLAPLQPYRQDLSARAAQLDQALVATLSNQHELVTIRDVPPWPDYDAFVYMMACPEGQYSGCALVCGNRVQAQWSIGGTVSPGIGGGVNVDLVFVENEAAREVLTFGVALGENDDQVLIDSVNVMFSKILAGAFERIDLRAVDSNPEERAKLDKAQREVLAASLAQFEAQQGDVDRYVFNSEKTKISKEDLARMNAGDEAKPWEVLKMSQGEYRRYENSGKRLDEWRKLRRGRFGQLVGRLLLGGGVGPYGQRMDSRYALDDQLQRVGLEQYQFVQQNSHLDVDFELGFGVLPWLDVTGLFAYHNGRFDYLIKQQRVGQPVVVSPRDQQQRTLGSWEVGARATVSPLMTLPVRPTLTAGISYWQGTTWQAFVQPIAQLEEMQTLHTLLVRTGPGVEVSASPIVNLTVRGFADIPIGGQRSEFVRVGEATIQERANTNPDCTPETNSGIACFRPSTVGWSIQAGVVIRIPVIGGTDSNRGSTMQFEDEDI